MNAQESRFDVLVAGAGPAGVAVALGLARLGYHVGVMGSPRDAPACEGVSERTLEGMRSAGFRRALECISDPVRRSVTWNGVERAANAERLVLREAFDAALWRDLQDAGIDSYRTRLEAVQREDTQGCSVRLAEGTVLGARFFVDARGRSAPRGTEGRTRGPESVSLLQLWRAQPAAAATRALACRDGWVWLGRAGDGLVFAQLCVSADADDLPRREGLGEFVRERLRALPDVADWLWGAEPLGEPTARASTAILHAPLTGAGMLRVGDAAMAVDPLSGNGIFQALSGAGVAPAVINTMLREPHHGALAMRFYEERIRHLFHRFARIGRDFYRAETRWSGAAFWRARATWPDDEAAHSSAAPRVLAEELRPVVDRGLIRERAVLVTSEQPLGVWRVAGVEIAPLLRELPESSAQRREELLHRIEAAARGDAAALRALHGWCTRHRLLEPAPEGATGD